MVALVELCSRLMYFPVIPKYSKANYAYKTMCKLSLVNILLGISLYLGQAGGSTHPSQGLLLLELVMSDRLSWLGPWLGSCCWFAKCCFGTLVQNFTSVKDEQWEVHGLCEDMPWRNLTFLYVCDLFFLKAGSDLKRALFCFGKWLLYRHFL